MLGPALDDDTKEWLKAIAWGAASTVVVTAVSKAVEMVFDEWKERRKAKKEKPAS